HTEDRSRMGAAVSNRYRDSGRAWQHAFSFGRAGARARHSRSRGSAQPAQNRARRRTRSSRRQRRHRGAAGRAMNIAECEGGKGLPEGFAELPAAVYAGDPLWIPEEPEETAFAFSSANPWFRAGRARTLAIPGRARVAVFCDPRTVIEGRQAAFFGYWESSGDAAAEAAVMDRACQWARQEGCEILYG